MQLGYKQEYIDYVISKAENGWLLTVVNPGRKEQQPFEAAVITMQDMIASGGMPKSPEDLTNKLMKEIGETKENERYVFNKLSDLFEYIKKREKET